MNSHLVYIDIDIAENFKIDVNLLWKYTVEHRSVFLPDTVYTLSNLDVGSIQIVQSREFYIKPMYTYTMSAIILLAAYCGTEDSIKHIHKVLSVLEDTEAVSMAQVLKQMGQGIQSNSCSDLVRDVIRYYMVELLNDMGIKNRRKKINPPQNETGLTL
jgi:hypothetical protein